MLDTLRPDYRYSVLDLGPPVGSNVEFFSAWSCRVRIADFHRSLNAESPESREPEAFGQLLERLLPLGAEERFDILLAWDVFNYLRPDQISALMVRFASVCRPRALVLALVSTRPQIPAAPLRYRIVDRENLACEGVADPVRPCPRYVQPDLARMMTRFVVKSSYLLRSGIQEYLFVSVSGDVLPGSALGAAGRC
jgi:hypothetical protein